MIIILTILVLFTLGILLRLIYVMYRTTLNVKCKVEQLSDIPIFEHTFYFSRELGDDIEAHIKHYLRTTQLNEIQLFHENYKQCLTSKYRYCSRRAQTVNIGNLIDYLDAEADSAKYQLETADTEFLYKFKLKRKIVSYNYEDEILLDETVYAYVMLKDEFNKLKYSVNS